MVLTLAMFPNGLKTDFNCSWFGRLDRSWKVILTLLSWIVLPIDVFSVGFWCLSKRLKKYSLLNSISFSWPSKRLPSLLIWNITDPTFWKRYSGVIWWSVFSFIKLHRWLIMQSNASRLKDGSSTKYATITQTMIILSY